MIASSLLTVMLAMLDNSISSFDGECCALLAEMPGVSKKSSCVFPMVRMPSMEQRVVLGLLLTAEIFSPIRAFNSVLFPTFGCPHSPTVRMRLPELV